MSVSASVRAPGKTGLMTRFAIGLVVATFGCTGVIGGVDGELPPVGVDAPSPEEPIIAGDTPLRRLNSVEYRAAVEDVFGVTLDSDHQPPTDQRAGIYDRDSSLFTVDASLALVYIDIAVWIARRAEVGELIDGDCRSDDACVQEWVAGLLTHAFRRPVSEAEVERYMGYFASARTRDNAVEGVRAVIAQASASPDFLYLAERRDGLRRDDGRTRLRDEAIVTRLAFLLWRRAPDAELLERAASGGVADTAGVAASVDMMLEDERADRVVNAFHNQWIELVRARAADGRAGGDEYGADLGERLERSMRLGIQRTFADDGSVAELLAGDGAYVDEQLAMLMGLEAPAESDEELSFVEGRRTGVILHPGFLAAHSHDERTAPILRGAFLLRRFVCAELGDPPPGAESAMVDPNITTTREQTEALTSTPACNSCHRRINPLGFALEGFDPLGRVRENDNGAPVDTADDFAGADFDGHFENAEEMLDVVVRSETVSDCYLRNWFRFAMARPAADSEFNTLMDTQDAWQADGAGIRAALRAVANSDAFLTRPQETL